MLGSLNMDISVTVPALPGPGATVLGGAAAFAPGGKGANQAVAAARLGAASGIGVRMVGCVGDDDFGRTLRAALRAEGVDDRAVRTVPGVPTGIAMITVDQAGENIITVAPGANREVGAAEIAATVRGHRQPPAAAHVLVISAEVPVPAIGAALGRDRAAALLTVLNLAPAPPEAAALVAARPGLAGGERVGGRRRARPAGGRTGRGRRRGGRPGRGRRAQRRGHRRRGRRRLLAARKQRRAAECRGAETVAGGSRSRAVDTVGAGDTFVGALAVALAAGDRAGGRGHRRRRGRRRGGHPARHPVGHAAPGRRPRRDRPPLARPGP